MIVLFIRSYMLQFKPKKLIVAPTKNYRSPKQGQNLLRLYRQRNIPRTVLLGIFLCFTFDSFCYTEKSHNIFKSK